MNAVNFVEAVTKELVRLRSNAPIVDDYTFVDDREDAEGSQVQNK